MTGLVVSRHVCDNLQNKLFTQQNNAGQMLLSLFWCKLFVLFIGWKPATWPANNCLQIMGWLCAMLPNCVWLQIEFCSWVNKTMRDRSCMKKGRSLHFPKILIKKKTWRLNDKTIIELGYRKISWFASALHINYLPQPSAAASNWSARPDKSQYFAQARPLIVNYPTGFLQ